jgi:hypothetical protein
MVVDLFSIFLLSTVIFIFLPQANHLARGVNKPEFAQFFEWLWFKPWMLILLSHVMLYTFRVTLWAIIGSFGSFVWLSGGILIFCYRNGY